MTTPRNLMDSINSSFFLSFSAVGTLKLLFILACKPAYSWHMLGCHPSAGTGALRTPQRPFGPILKIVVMEPNTLCLIYIDNSQILLEQTLYLWDNLIKILCDIICFFVSYQYGVSLSVFLFLKD